MRVYWKLLGHHVHMRVFLYGGKMGDLVCGKDEFEEVRRNLLAMYIEETDE